MVSICDQKTISFHRNLQSYCTMRNFTYRWLDLLWVNTGRYHPAYFSHEVVAVSSRVAREMYRYPRLHDTVNLVILYTFIATRVNSLSANLVLSSYWSLHTLQQSHHQPWRIRFNFQLSHPSNRFPLLRSSRNGQSDDH